MKTITRTMSTIFTLVAGLNAKAQGNANQPVASQGDESQVQSLRPTEVQDSRTEAILNTICSQQEVEMLNDYIFVVENGKIKILGKKNQIIQNTLEVMSGHSCISE